MLNIVPPLLLIAYKQLNEEELKIIKFYDIIDEDVERKEKKYQNLRQASAIETINKITQTCFLQQVYQPFFLLMEDYGPLMKVINTLRRKYGIWYYPDKYNLSKSEIIWTISSLLDLFSSYTSFVDVFCSFSFSTDLLTITYDQLTAIIKIVYKNIYNKQEQINIYDFLLGDPYPLLLNDARYSIQHGELTISGTMAWVFPFPYRVIDNLTNTISLQFVSAFITANFKHVHDYNYILKPHDLVLKAKFAELFDVFTREQLVKILLEL